MVLGGGILESLQVYGLIHSAQPLPSRCLYGFLAQRGRDLIQKSSGRSQRDAVPEGRGCLQMTYGPHLAPTCFSGLSFRRACTLCFAWRDKQVGKE